MLFLLQLLIAVFAIYSALEFPEEIKLFVPLGCLFLMLLISRLDRNKVEKETARKDFLKTEMDKFTKQDSMAGNEQNFFTVDSLLWPKNELLLIDAVHSILKDLGFRISTGVNYHSVDRIVKIPETEKAFGVQIMLCEKEADRTHPKILRAMQFEKEKKAKEKTFLVASTHVHLPLAEKDHVNHLSKELSDLLVRYHMSFITTHQLYELWQKAKGGEIDIFETFGKVYSHPGGPFFMALN
jgi:hypothetical protein